MFCSVKRFPLGFCINSLFLFSFNKTPFYHYTITILLFWSFWLLTKFLYEYYFFHVYFDANEYLLRKDVDWQLNIFRDFFLSLFRHWVTQNLFKWIPFQESFDEQLCWFLPLYPEHVHNRETMKYPFHQHRFYSCFMIYLQRLYVLERFRFQLFCCYLFSSSTFP